MTVWLTPRRRQSSVHDPQKYGVMPRAGRRRCDAESFAWDLDMLHMTQIISSSNREKVLANHRRRLTSTCGMSNNVLNYNINKVSHKCRVPDDNS